MSNLTDKQKRFCKEYVIDLNATQAAIRAGYSENSAKEIASENLTKPNIQSFIEELQNTKSNELNITFEQLAAIELEIAMEGKRESDRLKAIDQLSKKLGFYEKNNIQKKPITQINLKDLINFDD